MRYFLLLTFMILSATYGKAFESLKEYLWEKRIIAYTLSEEDVSLFDEQRTAYADEIARRDIIFISLDEKRQATLMQKLEAKSGRTELFLIGKDGTLKERIQKIDFQFLFKKIDQMPMRRREMRDD